MKSKNNTIILGKEHQNVINALIDAELLDSRSAKMVAVRKQELPFYKNFSLYDVIENLSAQTISSFIYGGGEPIKIDGTSNAILIAN